MGTITRLAELQYAELIRQLSSELPAHGLTEADITLYGRDLELVMRAYGQCDFVQDALFDKSDDYTRDTLLALAIRSTAAEIGDATKDCGLTAMAALMDYAAKIVLRDIHAHRDMRTFEAYRAEYAADSAAVM